MKMLYGKRNNISVVVCNHSKFSCVLLDGTLAGVAGTISVSMWYTWKFVVVVPIFFSLTLNFLSKLIQHFHGSVCGKGEISREQIATRNGPYIREGHKVGNCKILLKLIVFLTADYVI